MNNYNLIAEASGRFMAESISKVNPLNAGFFKETVEPFKCWKCQDEYGVYRKTSTKKKWCAYCYVKSHCNVVKQDGGIIIKNRRTGVILFNSSKRLVQRIEDQSIEILEEQMLIQEVGSIKIEV